MSSTPAEIQVEVRVELGGLLGDALEASRRGRLAHFIKDAHSPAIAVFAAEHASKNDEGDWYGEHAGKWLVAAAKAAARAQDAALGERVRSVADHLIGQQQSDGYLGTYAPARRFMVRQPGKAPTWDGAPSLRTWDIWIHSYLMLGLIEVHRQLAHPGALAAARRIGDLCWHALTVGGINITELGNHHGMSATVLMEPAVELYRVTRERRYLDLAELVLAQANANRDLALLPRALAGADAAEIATGKAYQLCWNLVGLAKLHQATGEGTYLQAVDKLWHSIREHHLTLGGGPWGGVAHRSREVFNAPGSFSPLAYVETCSTLAWIQLNRQLLEILGEARYADEIERSAYNDLLGAMAPNGEDWCYYSFPNGRRVHTTYWRCCKSSGAMALEELAQVAYGVAADGGLRVNLWGPGQASLPLTTGGRVTLEQHTHYPFDGAITLHVTPDAPATFELGLRIPAWAQGAVLRVNGEPMAQAAMPGDYARIRRDWQAGDCVTLDLPMSPVLQHKQLQNVQVSRAPDGAPVQQEVLCHNYVAITRGPLVYATGLIDGFKTEETIRRCHDSAAAELALLPCAAGEAPVIRFSTEGRAPLDFVPYFAADGRVHGGWRLTWLSLASASSKFP